MKLKITTLVIVEEGQVQDIYHSLEDNQDKAYQDSVLPANLTAVAIEAAQPDFWHKYVGRGAVIGMTTFGESAPAKDLYAHFNITAQAVVQAVQAQVA